MLWKDTRLVVWEIGLRLRLLSRRKFVHPKTGKSLISDTIQTRKQPTSFPLTHSQMTKGNSRCQEMVVYLCPPTTPTTPPHHQHPQQQQHQAVFLLISSLLLPQCLPLDHQCLLLHTRLLPHKHQDRTLWLSSIRVQPNLNPNNSHNSGMDLRRILISLDHSVARRRERVRVDLEGRSNRNSVHNNSSNNNRAIR